MRKWNGARSWLVSARPSWSSVCRACGVSSVESVANSTARLTDGGVGVPVTGVASDGVAGAAACVPGLTGLMPRVNGGFRDCMMSPLDALSWASAGSAAKARGATIRDSRARMKTSLGYCGVRLALAARAMTISACIVARYDLAHDVIGAWRRGGA